MPASTFECVPGGGGGGDDDDYNDSGAGAAAAAAVNLRACIDADAEQSKYGIYDEQAVARNKRAFDLGQYAAGSSKKRREHFSHARKNEVPIGGPGADPSFTTTGDKYYEDVHRERGAFFNDASKITDEQRRELKSGLRRVARLMHARRAAGTDAAAYADTSVARPNESLADYLERVRALDKAAADATAGRPDGDDDEDDDDDDDDYAWALSGTRNKRDFLADKAAAAVDKNDATTARAAASATAPVSDELADEATDDYVRTYATIPNSGGTGGKGSWMNSHRMPPGSGGGEGPGVRGGSGGGGGGDDDDDDGPCVQKVPIQIARSEIAHMQRLTARLYGEPISERDYVDSVRERVEKSASSGAMHTDGAESQNGVHEQALEGDLIDPDDVVPSGVGGDAEVASRGEHVESYTQSWRHAARANAQTTLLPVIDWSRTVYGHTSDEQCASIDPYLFLTSEAARELLVDDIGTHTQFECAARELRFSATGAAERTYDSIKEWARSIATCDAVFRKCLFYDAIVSGAVDDGDAVATAASADTRERRRQQQQRRRRSSKRMVICHDLKNGYFACTHFALVPRVGNATGVQQHNKEIFSDSYLKNAGDRTISALHRYLWLSHCYVEYLDAGAHGGSARAAAATQAPPPSTTTIVGKCDKNTSSVHSGERRARHV